MNQTDLEKMSMLYDELGIEYKVLKRADCIDDEEFYGHVGCYKGNKYPDYFNETITLHRKGDWFWMVFEFKDGMFVNYYATE